MSLKLLSLNIEADKHLDVVTKYLLNHKPDIICLQEIYLVHAKEIAAILGYNLIFAPHVNFKVQDGIFKPLGEWGICLLSALPLVSHDMKYYSGNKDQIPTHFMDTRKHPRAILIAKIRQGDALYTIATTHFTWALPEDADSHQADDFANLLPILKQLPSFVLCGDFNAPRETIVYQTLSQLYHSWIPLSIESTLDPLLFRKPDLKLVVDHLFSTSDYRLTEIKVLSGLSDHCALSATLDNSH